MKDSSPNLRPRAKGSTNLFILCIEKQFYKGILKDFALPDRECKLDNSSSQVLNLRWEKKPKFFGKH